MLKVETRSSHPSYPSHPGYILSGSSGSYALYKISGSDPHSARALIMESDPSHIPDQSCELSMLYVNDRDISPDFPQDQRDWNDFTIRVFNCLVLG